MTGPLPLVPEDALSTYSVLTGNRTKSYRGPYIDLVHTFDYVSVNCSPLTDPRAYDHGTTLESEEPV